MLHTCSVPPHRPSPLYLEMLLLSLLLLLATATDRLAAWNLSNLGLAASDFDVLHVSVFYVRAFICIRAPVRKRRPDAISEL